MNEDGRHLSGGNRGRTQGAVGVEGTRSEHGEGSVVAEPSPAQTMSPQPACRVPPTEAFEHSPLPSSVTAAATPTTANRDAGCGNFRYAAPVLAGRTGTRISTRISSSPTAVDIRPLNQSSTFTVRRPFAPSQTISAPSAMIAAG